jgi:hypothetical protein
MSGDMPIAHLPMIELLLVLDEMLRIGEHERANSLGTTEATEWAIAAQARAVAERAGATLDRRPYNSALLIVVAVQAACRCLRRPHMFPSIGFAAGYTERVCETRCTESLCRTWMLEIEQQTRAEAASAARETRRGNTNGWATAAASREAALALGLPALTQRNGGRTNVSRARPTHDGQSAPPPPRKLESTPCSSKLPGRSANNGRHAGRHVEACETNETLLARSATGLAPNYRTPARNCPHARRITGSCESGYPTRTTRCAPASPRTTQSHVSAPNVASDTIQPRATNSMHLNLRGYRLPRFRRAQ